VTTQLALFNATEARRLTDEVKSDAAALWAKLVAPPVALVEERQAA